MPFHNASFSLFRLCAVVLLLLICSDVVLVAGDDTNNHCNNPIKQAIIKIWVNGVRSENLYGMDARFGVQPPKDASATLKRPVALANPLNCCENSSSKFSDSIVLAKRGGCSYTDKAKVAVSGGASGLLVMNDADEVLAMGCGENDTSLDIKIPVLMITESAGYSIMQSATGRQVNLLLYSPDKPILEYSIIFLWLMALVTIVSSSLWSGADACKDLSSYGGNQGDPEETVEIQASSAIVFLITASAVLLILYYFMSKYFIWVLIVMFCIGGVSGLCTCTVEIISRLFKGCGQTMVDLPLFEEVSILSIVVLPFCVAFAIVWVANPNSSYGWIFQDLLGMSMMISGLRLVKMPNIKVATALLCCAFCYDIFWTFVSPLIFKKSVMVEVARSSNTGGRSIPMVLIIPRFFDPWGGTAILGFGDVMLPGLLVAFSYRYDILSGKDVKKGYFPWMLVGYSAGLGLTYLSLYLMKGKGQPALLYLVPCTLGLIVLMGSARKELRKLWSFKGE